MRGQLTFQEGASESKPSPPWRRDRWSTYFPLRAYFLPDITAWCGFAQKDLIGRVKPGLNSYLTWPCVARVAMRLKRGHNGLHMNR